MNPEQAQWFAETFQRLTDNVGKAVLGKPEIIRLVLTAMLAGGHVLLEDAPGTGKTQLAKALAASLQGTHNRIQFTPDLLPGDVTGINVYDQKKQEFEFHPGPIFASIVLADEINRASPKTQSALLEVMEESHVTVDGHRYDVGTPFMVIATQNPIEQAGTYKLPEAQLDRFLVKSSVGYPDLEAATSILAGAATRDRSSLIEPVITTAAVADMSVLVSNIYVDPAILRYTAQITELTREHPHTRLGISVRGGLAMIRCARVWAASEGRNYVTPDDVKQLALPVWEHRIVLDPEAEFRGSTAREVITGALAELPAPQDRAQV